MTSKQVMLIALLALALGCRARVKPADPLVSPYPARQVWAVAPFRNESGSLSADGLLIADQVARQLENAAGLDVLPVNRTLAAMEAAGIAQPRDVADAMKLLSLLGADGLVLGTISSFEPYDPPKLGLAMELYMSAKAAADDAPDLRQLSRSPTDDRTLHSRKLKQPVSVVSGYFDAADPTVRESLKRYALDRGSVVDDSPQAFRLKRLGLADADDEEWHRYRISMDLYSEFVSYAMSWRLLRAESLRIAPPPATQPAR